MLVLSRKEGERLVIGDNITLVVSKISGNRVTIGIEAPKDVKIVRSELEVGQEVVPASKRVKERPQPVALKDYASSIISMHRQVG